MAWTVRDRWIELVTADWKREYIYFTGDGAVFPDTQTLLASPQHATSLGSDGTSSVTNAIVLSLSGKTISSATSLAITSGGSFAVLVEGR